MYYQGLGVDKDLEKAKECYRRAAPHHHNARLLLEELELEEKQNENKKPEEQKWRQTRPALKVFPKLRLDSEVLRLQADDHMY